MTWIDESQNPEVAGSNPAPATEKGPGNRAFPLVEQERDAGGALALLCHGQYGRFSIGAALRQRNVRTRLDAG
jgi:hypothetical protein